jgi:D-tyrosyl-tRNA(Tyr) deacylase
MKAVIQRVKKAICEVDGKVVSHIDRGVLIFLGVEKGDTLERTQKLAYKCANLRIFEDTNGKMNLSVNDVGDNVMVISQFTLCVECKKGLRPSFDNAEECNQASILYKKFIELLKNQCLKVQEGIFGEKMLISLENDGPVTFILSE